MDIMRNATIINLANTDDVTEKAKHIECKFRFVKALAANGVIDVKTRRV